MGKLISSDNLPALFGAIKQYIEDVGAMVNRGCDVILVGSHVTLSTNHVDAFRPTVITVTEDDGYALTGITITMGGNDITTSAWDGETNSIIISRVKGDIEVTVTTLYLLSLTLDGLSLTGGLPKHNQSWSTGFSAATGKQLVPSTVVVTMGGIDVTKDVYNLETNQIVIPSVTNNVTITARAETVDSAYKPLEYIATRAVVAGNRITLPYHPNTNTKLVMDVELALKSYSALYSVATTSSTTPNYFFWAFVHNTTVWRLKHGTYHQDTTSDKDGRIKTGERITFTNNKGTVTYKNQAGNNFTRYCSTSAFNLSSNSLGIMTHITSGAESAHMACDGKIFGVEISEPTSDALNVLLNYVPVVRLSDGAVGIYDTVNGNAIINSNYIAPYANVGATLSNATAALLSTNDTGTTTKAVYGKTWICKYTPLSGYMFSEFSVMINNVDKTSEVATYDSTTNEYTVTLVAHWNDTISITANAVDVITFEDDAVKAICVENWGGGTIAGEMTKAEAAAVTSLASKFKSKTNITKFNELQYFTGLTSLYVSGNRTSAQGEFYGCTGLREVTLPAVSMTNISGAFRGCTNANFTSIDLSPLVATGNMNGVFHTDSQLTTVTLPGGSYTNSMWSYTFRACTALTTITFAAAANLSGISEFTDAFWGCSSLTTISGTITGINQSVNFVACPLTTTSAIVVLNGLSSSGSGKTCTLKSSMKSTYEANADFNTAVSTATANGWTIAYA